MKTINESRTLNYERPQIYEIDLAPQGVLCDSVTGTGESSYPGIVYGADDND